ncbi:PRC-barrel domain containing protein [Cellulosimicrobium cellulans]|uniref:PRC-barrel domain containing protein n=1 Tax=Cellulosimicrobium cellulans TaxID=1710 RepID=UPI0019664916|nr:PRC-barrel domain containing protein [Cellulosimicrobium cellulans]MBN0040836.1 PRC-barrel domain containing protein [Cellulosimicrobium cellulans]
MILGDLLDARVLGPDGEDLGFLVDVRLALDTLPDGGPSGRDTADDADPDDAHPDDRALSESVRRRARAGRARVVGVLVSPRTGTSFLGYERTDVTAPWPVPQLVRRRHRGTFLVPWDDVAAVAPGEVRLAAGYRQEDAALP